MSTVLAWLRSWLLVLLGLGYVDDKGVVRVLSYYEVWLLGQRVDGLGTTALVAGMASADVRLAESERRLVQLERRQAELWAVSRFGLPPGPRVEGRV